MEQRDWAERLMKRLKEAREDVPPASQAEKGPDGDDLARLVRTSSVYTCVRVIIRAHVCVNACVFEYFYLCIEATIGQIHRGQSSHESCLQ